MRGGAGCTTLPDVRAFRCLPSTTNTAGPLTPPCIPHHEARKVNTVPICVMSSYGGTDGLQRVAKLALVHFFALGIHVEWYT